MIMATLKLLPTGLTILYIVYSIIYIYIYNIDYLSI